MSVHLVPGRVRTGAVLAMLLFSAPSYGQEGGAGGAGPESALGAACESTAECEDPALTCLLPNSTEFADRGPPGGLCTIACVDNLDCEPYSPGGQCLYYTEGLSYCFEGCAHNDAFTPDLSPTKCHGRPDMACNGTERGLTSGACLPLCATDAQCGSGLYCNRGWGLCQSEPVEGLVVGATCDPLATEPADLCAGFCTTWGTGQTTCTEYCTIGAPAGCGWSGEGAPEAYCLGSFTGGGLATGDLGGCSELCNCTDDCLAEGFACSPTALAGPSGARGICLPEAYVALSLTDCDVPEDLGECVYGLLRACKGENDCLGTSECNADRTGYSECVCVDAGAMDAGVVVPGGGGEGGAPPTEQVPRAPESSCGCSTPGNAAGYAGWSALLALALAALRRGRRVTRR